MAFNPTDACGLMDQSIPQWKRELIIRRRALGRTLQVGSSTVKLTCPAVVAIVRQPETLGPGENVAASKHHSSSTSEESTSTVSSLNQNRVDFHPSTSSAVSVSVNSVGNMRLLDACSDVNNLVINGIDVKNKQGEVVSSDLCVNYNLIMGEDKSLNLKKKSATSRPIIDQNNCSVNREQKCLIDQVTNEGINGKHAKDEDCLSDSSEELQYGPGIVNKLKSKYLSMTLREQKRRSRPSIINLRRATSLENMLEVEGNLNKQNKSVIETNIKTEHISADDRSAFKGKSSGLNSHRAMKHLGNYRSLETMKRARSMDTLLKSESRTPLKNCIGADNRQHIPNKDLSIRQSHEKQIASIGLINENIIIVENVGLSTGISPEPCKQEHVLSKDSPKHKRSGNKIPTDKELPPPDLVKQTLKIFETSPKRKVKPPSQTNLAKLVGYSNSTSQPVSSGNNRLNADKTKNNSNKPTLSPKPVLSPDKLRQNRSRLSSPKKSQSNNNLVSNIRSPTKVNKNLAKQQLQLEILDQTNNTNITKPERGIGVTSPKITSPRNVCALVTVVPNREPLSPTTTLHDRNNSLNSPKIEDKERTLELDEFEEVDSTRPNDCSKPVPECALENIRRGGVSMQFSFNEDPENSSVSKSYLPRSKSPPQALNTSLLKHNLEKPPHSASISPLRSTSSPHTKQVGIIRPLVSTKIQSSNSSSPALTEQEIEKNLINRAKSIEQPISKVVVAIKSLPDNVVLGSVSSELVTNKSLSIPRMCANSKTKTQGLWDERLWQQNQNTVVFNFSDRKEVPDYIENDGLILRGKRDRPMPGDDGIILLDGAAEESSTDEDLLALDPPSPCDVTFEGDNVLINGKSNLKKSPRQVKLRIKFDDEATRMFEYPSEASLVEEEAAGNSEEAATAPPSANLPMALGVPPPNYLPPPPPVPRKDLHNLPPPSPHSTVGWPSAPPCDLVVKARAPRPPLNSSGIRPPVPRRAPLRRSPSDPGRPSPGSGVVTHPLPDKSSLVTAKKDSSKTHKAPAIPSKDKYFSIRKTHHCAKTEPLGTHEVSPVVLNEILDTTFVKGNQNPLPPVSCCSAVVKSDHDEERETPSSIKTNLQCKDINTDSTDVSKDSISSYEIPNTMLETPPVTKSHHLERVEMDSVSSQGLPQTSMQSHSKFEDTMPVVSSDKPLSTVSIKDKDLLSLKPKMALAISPVCEKNEQQIMPSSSPLPALESTSKDSDTVDVTSVCGVRKENHSSSLVSPRFSASVETGLSDKTKPQLLPNCDSSFATLHLQSEKKDSLPEVASGDESVSVISKGDQQLTKVVSVSPMVPTPLRVEKSEIQTLPNGVALPIPSDIYSKGTDCFASLIDEAVPKLSDKDPSLLSVKIVPPPVAKLNVCEKVEPRSLPSFTQSNLLNNTKYASPSVVYNYRTVGDSSKSSSSVSLVSNKRYTANTNSDIPQPLSLPYIFPSPMFSDSNNAPVYCPVYSKPSSTKSLLSKNSCADSTLKVSDLKVDSLLQPKLSKKTSCPAAEPAASGPQTQVLVLNDWPLGTESLV